MKEDEYIDLDKINVTPNGEGMPGFSKEQEKEIKAEVRSEKKAEKRTETKPAKKTAAQSKKKKTTTKKTTAQSKPKKVKKTKKNKPSNKTLLYLLLGILLLAIIILVIATLREPTDDAKEQKVLALVNGEPLSEAEIETRNTWLEMINGMNATQEQIINLSIDIELLYQEAQKQNMSVDEEEIDEIFNQMAQGVDFTKEELKNYLESIGINTEILRDIIRKEIVAGQLIEKETQATITQEEIEEHYENNKQLFVHDELAKIRHIQISFTNKTDEETYNETLKIYNQIDENKTNFCELVEEHTYDINTKDNCGEYVFEIQDSYDDEFSKQSFELEDGELDIVKTEAGYHVLWKVETINPGISSLDDVKDIIELQLEKERSEQLYLELLEELRANATIEYYTGQELIPENQEIDETIIIDITNESEEIIEENESIYEVMTEDDENLTVDDETQNRTLDDEDDETQNQTFEDTDNETQEITISYEESVDLENEDMRNLRLAQCLTDKGAKMYTVYWSPHGQEQKEAFTEGAEHLRIIECDAEGVNPKITECKNTLQKQYPTWPTWQINGELYEGYQNLNVLADLAGCEY